MITKQIAKHFREIYFGGNWTWSNLKDNLSDVTWEQATTQVHSLNTIATLTYHIHYFVTTATNVSQNKPLNAHDKFSFDHPPIHSSEDWKNFLDKVFADGEIFASLIEQVSDDKLGANFYEEKYGNYYRNLHGIIEHAHYHLGQIALIKKIIQQEKQK